MNNINKYPSMDPHNTVKGRYFTPAEIAAAKGEEHPPMLNVSLYLTKKCNIDCIDCFTKAMHESPSPRKGNELLGATLSLSEYYSIIDECARLGTKTINLVGEGEPILDPNFKAIIRHIHAKGIVPLIATNGLALAENPDLIDFLYEHNATIVIKIRSFDKKFQDILVKREGYADLRDQVLSLLIQKGFNKETPTRLMVNILAINDREDILNIYRRCRAHNIIPEVADYIPTGRTQGGVLTETIAIERNPNLSSEEKKTYLARLQPTTPERKAALEQGAIEIDKEFGIQRWETEPRAYRCGTTCSQIFGVLINNRGNIYPCVAESERLGNLRKTTLEEIRKGVTMQKIRTNADGGCPYKPHFAKPLSSQ